MSNDDEKIVVQNSAPFVMVPVFVLDKASAQAVKLYAVLQTFANRNTHEAYPSRARLAERMGFNRPQSVDQYLVELENIGALEVKREKFGGRNALNVYHMLYEGPQETQDVVAPENALFQLDEERIVRSGEKNSALQRKRIVRQSAHEPEPYNYNQGTRGCDADATLTKSADRSKAEGDTSPEAQIAKRAYDATKGALSYMGIRQIAAWAINQGHYEPARVEAAMSSLHQNGKPINKPLLSQTLEGIVKPGQSPYKKQTTSERLAAIQALKYPEPNDNLKQIGQ